MIAILALFVVVYISNSRKSKIEDGKSPIHSERCGARIGFWNWTFPFVRLALYEEFLILKSLGTLHINYNDIARLEKAGMISKGLKIVVKNKASSQPIIWSTNYKKLQSLLNEKINNAS